MLPDGFRFSQTSLQDYVDCARRFQLRYVESQVWPGVQVEPVLDYERHIVRGSRFHRLVERHQLGLDVGVLTESVADDPELLEWWRAYLGFDMLHGLDGPRFPELALSARVSGVSLMALFDLVVVSGSRVFIFDWKMYGSVLSRVWFQARLQTRVYLCVMGLQGARFLGDWFSVEQLSLVYWVSGEVVVFEYSPALFSADRVYLGNLLLDVLVRDRGVVWPLVGDVGVCRYCEYRSLCDRGIGGEENRSNMTGNIAGGVDLFLGDGGVEVGF